MVNAIAGKLFRSDLNLPINSAAICCESAALPPFPKMTILCPDFNDFMINLVAFSIS